MRYIKKQNRISSNKAKIIEIVESLLRKIGNEKRMHTFSTFPLKSGQKANKYGKLVNKSAVLLGLTPNTW